MKYEMSDLHGTPLGEFTKLPDAVEALRDLYRGDPESLHDVAILVFNDDGERVPGYIGLDPDDPYNMLIAKELAGVESILNMEYHAQDTIDYWKKRSERAEAAVKIAIVALEDPRPGVIDSAKAVLRHALREMERQNAEREG